MATGFVSELTVGRQAIKVKAAIFINYSFLFCLKSKKENKYTSYSINLTTISQYVLFCLDTKKNQKKSRQNECSVVLPASATGPVCF